MRTHQTWIRTIVVATTALCVAACGSAASNSGVVDEDQAVGTDATADDAVDVGQDTASAGTDATLNETVGSDAKDSIDAPDVVGSDAEDVTQPDVQQPQPPTVTILSPQSGTLVPAGLPLTVTLTTADPDSPLSALKVTVTDAPAPSAVWTLAGPDTSGGWTATATLPPGEHTVTVEVKDETGGSATANVTLIATEVALPVLTLTPSAPKSDQDLVATVDLGATGVLPLGEVSIDFAWSINGSPVQTTGSTLPAALYVGGDKVKVVATITASAVPGWQVVLDATVTIAPSAPTAPVVAITPDQPDVAAQLQCAATATDGDNQELSYTFVWTVNGVPLAGAPTGSTLDLANHTSGAWAANWPVKAGDLIGCTATAFDGTFTGPAGFATTTLNSFDPCTTEFSGCDSNATCTPGASVQAQCACNDGFAGDGTTCKKVIECGVETVVFLEDVTATTAITKGSLTATGGSLAAAAVISTFAHGLGVVGGTSDDAIDSGEVLKLTFSKPVSQVEVTVHASKGTVMQTYFMPAATDVTGAPVGAVSGQQATGPGNGAWVTFHWIYPKPVASLALQVSSMGVPTGLSVTQVTLWHEALEVADLQSIGTCTTGTPACAMTEISHIFGALTLSGSGQLYFLPSNGVGIVGGTADALIDGQELLNLAFASPVTKVMFAVSASMYTPDPWAELFDVTGASILKAQGTTLGLPNAIGKFIQSPAPFTSAVLHANTSVDNTGGIRVGTILTGECPATSCPTGFSSDGNACKDINECAAGSAGCALAADCTNTVGSFTCTCKGGYTGDGTTCAPVQECGILTASFLTDIVSVPSVYEVGITVSGSANVTVTGGFGVGVVGGTDNTLIEGNEKLFIAYDKPVSQVEMTFRAPSGQNAAQAYTMLQHTGVSGQPANPIWTSTPSLGNPELVTHRWIFPEPITSTSISVMAMGPSSGLALSHVTAWTEQLQVADLTKFGTCSQGLAQCAVTEPTQAFGNMTLSGSADLYFLPLNGVGIVGGSADDELDGTETLTLAFATPVTKLLFLPGITSATPDPWVELFDGQGKSLQSVPNVMQQIGNFITLSGGFSSATLYANYTTSSTAGFNISTLVWGTCPVAAPVP